MNVAKAALALAVAVLFAPLVPSVAWAAPAQDAPSASIVISEIMYHPAADPDETDDLDNNEFIELANVGDIPVSLLGFQWTSGVTGTFGDVTVGPGEFVLVSPDSAATVATYGVTPVAVYSGKVSNGGETLTLADGAGNVVDEVTYSDDPPWPVRADGDGPSLELIDLSTDNNLAANWQASASGGSPGDGPVVVQPSITDVAMQPAEPTDSDAVVISATVTGAAAVNLHYRVGFGPEATVVMASTADRWSGVIPAQAAAELVRYRLETVDGDGAVLDNHPPPTGAKQYEGYVVASPEFTTGIGRFQWFMDQADFDEMLGDSRFDRDRLFPAVVAYQGRVYDGVEVQVRGGDYARTNFPKQSFNVEFPSGAMFDEPDLFSAPVDELALQAEYSDATKGRAHASWYVFEQEGFDPVASNFTQVDLNKEFYGVYRISEKLDGTWRDLHGYGDANFYKADGGWQFNGFDQKEGDDDDPILDDVRALLLSADSDTKTAALYDTFDVPNIVNYLALTLVLLHSDQRIHNFYVSHDLADTGRVALHPWDLDKTWAYTIGTCSNSPMTDPTCVQDPLFDSFWAIPEMRQATYRRIRSILDTTLEPTTIEDRHAAMLALVGPELIQLEADTWGRPSMTVLQPGFDRTVQERRRVFDELAAVPDSQTQVGAVVISELHYNPVDGEAEFLELTNTGTERIDLSAWQIEGVGLDIPFGTTVGAGQQVVFTDDDRAFRDKHPGLEVVVVQYPGGLKGSGETITLLDRDGSTIDQVSYSNSDPWPSEPDDGLVSLELINPTADNSLAESWRASETQGGTPGQAPDDPTPPGETTVTVRARGTTGVEQIELRDGDTVLATVALTTAMTLYPLEVDASLPFNSLRVAFINDAFSNGVDRNVQVDYVEVDGERREAEAETVFSTGTFDGSCDDDYKSSEFLHCNGYFDFGSVGDPDPDPDPDPEGSKIEVLAAGQAGGEELQLRIDDVVVSDWTLEATTNFYGDSVVYQNLTYTHSASVNGTEIQVDFVNDGTNNGVDRNVRIDTIVVDGRRYESEDPAVSSKGVWVDGLCNTGNWSSEYLHCNGYFSYGTVVADPDPDPDPDGSTIVVLAAGHGGQERLELSVNGTLVADWTLEPTSNFYSSAVPYQRLTYTHSTTAAIADIRLTFSNDGFTNGVDRDVRLDAVIVDGVRHESEAPTVQSNGVWEHGGQCGVGFWQSEFLNCNGYFDF